jgi:hypothetical protein
MALGRRVLEDGKSHLRWRERLATGVGDRRLLTGPPGARRLFKGFLGA